jgi:hypothetical protein
VASFALCHGHAISERARLLGPWYYLDCWFGPHAERPMFLLPFCAVYRYHDILGCDSRYTVRYDRESCTSADLLSRRLPVRVLLARDIHWRGLSVLPEARLQSAIFGVMHLGSHLLGGQSETDSGLAFRCFLRRSMLSHLVFCCHNFQRPHRWARKYTADQLMHLSDISRSTGL